MKELGDLVEPVWQYSGHCEPGQPTAVRIEPCPPTGFCEVGIQEPVDEVRYRSVLEAVNRREVVPVQLEEVGEDRSVLLFEIEHDLIGLRGGPGR